MPNRLPDKPDSYWWWSPLRGSDARFLVGVELTTAPQDDPLDWHVWCCVPLPHTRLGMGWVGTGRTVRTMGGVWLGPVAPPPKRED